MSDTIIKLKNLCFYYEKTPILENVSLSIKQGSFNAIIGPNGGGKTTLLKLLLGLLQPTSGQILLKNLSPQDVRDQIGYVPQSVKTDSSFPITLYQVVLLGRVEMAKLFSRYPKEIKKRADELIEILSLSKHKNKAFGSLSGGLKQRTLIARALLSDPEFLFLDEPTASIDPENQEKIFSLLQNYRGKKTILMVTHDLESIFKKVDKVFSCQRSINSYLPEEVCKHFAFGLYHTPLSKKLES